MRSDTADNAVLIERLLPAELLLTDCARLPWGTKVELEEGDLLVVIRAGTGFGTSVSESLGFPGDAPGGGAEVPCWLLGFCPP